MRRTLLLFILLGACAVLRAQTQFTIPPHFRSGVSDTLTQQVVNALDQLLASMRHELPDAELIDTCNAGLHQSFIADLAWNISSDAVAPVHAQLISLNPIDRNRMLLTLLYSKGDEVRRIVTLLVRSTPRIVFASPLEYNTATWRRKRIGTLTFIYPDTIDVARAESFERKNVTMAGKLGLPVRHWDVYQCQNYQQILQLQGFYYEATSNGLINSGAILDPRTIFTVMGDEDFSHDVLHCYAGAVRGQERNANAECGLAYHWGNAYYPDSTGKAPSLEQLKPLIQRYLQENPKADLLALFEEQAELPASYKLPLSVRLPRVMGGIICQEVERQKGTAGLIELLKCGRGNDNFFQATEKLIGLKRDNFNREFRKIAQH